MGNHISKHHTPYLQKVNSLHKDSYSTYIAFTNPIRSILYHRGLAARGLAAVAFFFDWR
jgi:hypothetical protein